MSIRLLGHGMAWVGVLLVGLWVAGESLWVPWVVAGQSMEPTLFHGDRVLVDRWTYRHRLPRIGELVLFEGPDGNVMVKRVAASPPHSTRRPVLHGLIEPEAGPTLWLLGDNPMASRDSRRFGPISSRRVRGRVILRFWPLAREPIQPTRSQ